MILLIDDIRDLNVDVIARTGEVALEILDKMKFTRVLFDHDLGDGINGLQTLEMALSRKQLDDTEVILVTSNPVGRKKMEDALKDYGFIFVRLNPYQGYWKF